jgi:3-hydroxyisobutyrate dehydrogenase
MTSIAVLGTGTMGAPIARNLLKNGFEVRAWNRTRERAEPLATDGALVAGTPEEAARGADLVLTMLADGPTTAQVIADAAPAPGTVWIQLGTIGIDWTQRLAEGTNLVYVDAPVSGSEGPAREGTLLILASGPDEARERVQPVFDAIGSRTLWLGPAGTGSRFKLVLNNWLVVLTEGIAESLALAQRLDLDPAQLLDVLEGAPLGSPYAVMKGRNMLSGALAPAFPLRHATKDAMLVIDAAEAAGLDLPMTEALLPAWRNAVNDGHGDEDVAAVARRYGLGGQ